MQRHHRGNPGWDFCSLRWTFERTRFSVLKFSFASPKAPLAGRFALPDRVSVLAVALLLASWLMPLHFLPWVSWHSELLAFCAVACLAWQRLWQMAPGGIFQKVELPRAALFFVLLALIVVVQAMLGLITFAGDALVIVLYLALCAAVFVLGFESAGRSNLDAAAKKWDVRGLIECMAYGLMIGALLSAMIALAQVLEVWDTNAWVVSVLQPRRPGANLAQPNQLATLLMMGLASLLYLLESGRLSKGSAILVFLVLATGLAVTESRAGLLSFLVLVLWWFVGRVRVGFELSWGTASVASAICLILFFTWPLMMATMGNFEPNAAVRISPGLRLTIWPQLLEAVAMRPWWGWGVREISEAHNAVAHAYEISEPFTYSHNILIDSALGMGLPLTLLLVCLVVSWLWRRALAVRSMVSWYALATVLPVAVHSMLEFPYAYAYFLVPAVFMLGVLERGTTDAQSRLMVGRRGVALGLIVVTVVGAWSVLEYVAVEEDFRIARFEALRLGQVPVDHQRPRIYLLTQLDAMLNGARIVPQTGMSGDQLELARKVALRFPWPALQNRYALSLALNGNPDEAMRQLRVMRALHGEKAYADIKASWISQANDKYPQLHELVLP